MNSVFQLNSITKKFKNQTVLDDVSLTGEKGKVIALLGENGAGKTTAIKIMLGFLKPDSGSCEVLGMNSLKQGLEIRQRVGYVSDNPSLYEWMTIHENGWFAAGFYPSGYFDRYQELIKNFNLDPAKKIKELSKGMRAKVALATASAHEPELLVLDEPTTGLDSMVRREFLESMGEVAGAGRTVFLSSHQIHEVERVADTIAILRDGKILIVESLDNLKQNCTEVTITHSNGSLKLPSIPGDIIRVEQRDRQSRILVRNFDNQQFQGSFEEYSIQVVDIRKPSLEEIFVGYMKDDSEPQSIGTDEQSAAGENQ